MSAGSLSFALRFRRLPRGAPADYGGQLAPGGRQPPGAGRRASRSWLCSRSRFPLCGHSRFW